mmetsp:Transcript_24633/g.53123  ORF Transcript_24633/g.53123 Transcript_24633/m.53123 type:complete len:95 (+) Transcript_24633:2287-2571(+)
MKATLRRPRLTAVVDHPRDDDTMPTPTTALLLYFGDNDDGSGWKDEEEVAAHPGRWVKDNSSSTTPCSDRIVLSILFNTMFDDIISSPPPRSKV